MIDATIIQDRLRQAIEAKLLVIREHQEELVTAFIAKYGCDPGEVEMISTNNHDGSTTLIVRKRRNPGRGRIVVA